MALMLHLLTFILTPSWAVLNFAIVVPSNKNNSLENQVLFCKGMFPLFVDQTLLKSTLKYAPHLSLSHQLNMHWHILQKKDKSQEYLGTLSQLHHGILLVWANHFTSLATLQRRNAQFCWLVFTEHSRALQKRLMCHTESQSLWSPTLECICSHCSGSWWLHTFSFFRHQYPLACSRLNKTFCPRCYIASQWKGAVIWLAVTFQNMLWETLQYFQISKPYYVNIFTA